MQILKLPYCAECGEARTSHHLEKIPEQLDAWFMRFALMRTVFAIIDGVLESFFEKTVTPNRVLAVMRALEKISLVRVDPAPTAHHSTRTHALYEGAAAAGVTLYTLLLGGLPLGFVAEKKVGDTVRRVCFRVIPRPPGPRSASFVWMDDKGILKEKLQEANIPCAAGGIARTEEEALQIFRNIKRAVITKPHKGSRGRHTTLDMRTEEEVRNGFRIAAKLSSKVVVEAYLKGTVHRVTLVGKKPVAVARREYPHVIGDGTHTVDELVETENRNPLRDGFFYRKLDTEHRALQSLEKQHLTLASIPPRGMVVILNDKNSRLHGTVTEDVTDIVHPENMELFRRLGEMLQDPIVGVDFIIADITRSWKEQADAGVLECNSMPFIDVHHKVASGRTINVARFLWEEVFA